MPGTTKPERRLRRMSVPTDLVSSVRVLAFDIFGTVVDWHGSIVREMAQLHPEVDGDAFARAWREDYRPAMARVMSGELGWTRIDDLHRMILDDILPRFGLAGLAEAERAHLNRVWHRLHPWMDSVEGLTRIKRRTRSARCPTATSGCSRTWPSAQACRGIAFFQRRCSAPTSRIRRLILALRECSACHPGR